AVLRTRSIKRREARRRDDSAVGEAAVLVAELEVVENLEFLVGVVSADQPVELVIECIALEPQLLAQRIEFAFCATRVAIQYIDAAVVDVPALIGSVVPVGADRRQRSSAEVVIDLVGKSPIASLARVVTAGRDRQDPAVARVKRIQVLTEVAKDVDDV